MTTLTEIRTMWSNDTMGAIIGSGGKNITQVKQKNNTTITITKEPARVMLSTGGAVAAEVAAKPWRTLNIDGEWCSIWNSLCDIIKGVGVIPPPSPAAEPLGTTAPAATTFHFLMKIPIPVAGMLVGKGGANLKEWRQKWPTALFEVQADNKDPVFRYLYLKGSSVDLCESCISIADVLEQALLKLKENGEDPLAALNSMTGAAPGVGGGETSRENNKNRTRNQQPGGASKGGGAGGFSNGPLTSGSNNVNVGAGNNSNAGGMNYMTSGGNNGGYVGGLNGGQPTINSFTGTPAPNGTNNYNFGGIGAGGSNKAIATAATSSFPGTTPSAADPDVKLRHAIADATAMEALTTLTLREDQIGRVIGKKGENINKVRECTACTITTDTKGDRTDGVREVQICGPIAQVMTALHMVQTMLALETIHGHGGGGIGRRGN
eukprot:g4645.t1